MSATADDHGEFVAAARAAMRDRGSDPLDALGWWDLLPRLGEEEPRAAVFALFRAQGRELADSPALGGLLAQPYVDASGAAPGSVVAAVRRESTRQGPVWVVVGELGGRRVLFDDPDRGVHLVEPDALELRAVDVPGHGVVHEASVDLAAHDTTHDLVSDPEAVEQARSRSEHLGRVALASEILGAAEGAVDLAVQHACDREQFGQPIGCFQAVRHLLAWAETDCVAIDHAVRAARLLLEDPPPRSGEVVKALAGRNGRRACQRSLQVLGGIGFTAEHPHHHHYSRVLLLDALLGSSAQLTHQLGTWLRTTGADPGYPAAILHAGAR